MTAGGQMLSVDPAVNGIARDAQVFGDLFDGYGSTASTRKTSSGVPPFDEMFASAPAKDGSAESRRAYRELYQALSEGNFRETARGLHAQGSDSVYVNRVLDFILGPSDRSFLTPRAHK